MPGPINLKRVVSDEVEKGLKKKLKIPTGGQLPAAVKSMLNKASSEADKIVTERFIKKESLLAARSVMKDVTVKDAVNSRLKNALQGVQLVSQSSDLQKMIDENAKMLFQKKAALESAGFTDVEAFQLILAEVSAKKAK